MESTEVYWVYFQSHLIGTVDSKFANSSLQCMHNGHKIALFLSLHFSIFFKIQEISLYRTGPGPISSDIWGSTKNDNEAQHPNGTIWSEISERYSRYIKLCVSDIYHKISIFHKDVLFSDLDSCNLPLVTHDETVC